MSWFSFSRILLPQRPRPPQQQSEAATSEQAGLACQLSP